MKSAKELFDALQNMIEGRHTMRVPPNEDKDEDLILAEALEELVSLRASAAEKEEEIERQAERIAELEDVGRVIIEAHKLSSVDWPAMRKLESIISTPTGAKERIEKAVWEEAAEIMEKEGNESASARMGALGEFCFEIAGDFRKRAEGET